MRFITWAASLAGVVVGAGALGAGPGGSPGAVFTMTNSADGNAIVAYQRFADGTLGEPSEFSTGGLGTGAGLGNQGGVVLSHNWLFAVNAGSNDVSVFHVGRGGLTLTDVEASLGEMPISVAVHEDLVYVLNGAGAGGIQGFLFDGAGDLTPIEGSARPLSGADVAGPAQIGFSPDGATIVVTEKATSLIDTYVVLDDGTTDGPFVFRSSGMTPFGFDFSKDGDLLVSEAFGGARDASAASSYAVGPGGELAVVSASVPNTESAMCWLVTNNNGKFCYVTNTGSGTVSGYSINKDTGEIALLDDDGVTGVTGEGSAPIDAAFSTNGQYLYVLASGTGEIHIFKAHPGNGSLTPVDVVGGLPGAANGLAAR